MKAVKFFIFLFFLTVINLSYATTLEPCKTQKCVAVVDAGSSGSRLYIYGYDLNPDGYPVNINEVWGRRVEPGFSTLEAKNSAVENYLNKLFADVPFAGLPVYFYATGGMRLLPKKEQEQYYGLLVKWFQNNEKWHLKIAKTIYGKEEGVLDWLSVNYQLGRLDNPGSKLVSVMDMGGASVQVAIPVTDTGFISNQNNVAILNIYGREIFLFTHSFLGLGRNELSHQFLDTGSCYAHGFELPSGEYAHGDAYDCTDEIANLINHVHSVKNIVGPVVMQNPNLEWYAIGGVYRLMDDPVFNTTNKTFTASNMLQKANDLVCHASWSDLTQKYPNHEYIYSYCFIASYFYSLIKEGYQVDENQSITYFNNDTNTSWTLGVVLTQRVSN